MVAKTNKGTLSVRTYIMSTVHFKTHFIKPNGVICSSHSYKIMQSLPAGHEICLDDPCLCVEHITV
jgi:hypothetical protein